MQSKPYQHSFADLTPTDLPVGKIVCVGRNYAEHAKELNNPIPQQPLLFIKPATAAVSLAEPLRLPTAKGECHHELEIALLIGERIGPDSKINITNSIAGIGLALDLTLRELQNELKAKGHPWERAKSFDGACPISAFVKPNELPQLDAIEFSLERNGQLQQQGNSKHMLFAIADLLAEIANSFTLMPGDVVLTGTPAGVGPLNSGDQLRMSLADKLSISTRVL